ncbi:hypothetical protein GQ600_25935 [Phytophthora cactorum]|nr:hypothetical protein GQ600_25935 [Phytophthora cactorum]
MRPPKSALDFTYLLNSTARNAGSDIRHPGKRLEKHVRRFATKLWNNRLKTSLQGRRFKSTSDLEYILEQDEDDVTYLGLGRSPLHDSTFLHDTIFEPPLLQSWHITLDVEFAHSTGCCST